MAYTIALRERLHDGGRLDVEELKKELEGWFGKDSDADRKARVLFPKDRSGYVLVKIVTSYKMVREVMPAAYYIAVKFSMDIADVTGERHSFSRNMFEPAVADMKIRASELNRVIREKFKPYRIRELECNTEKSVISFVVISRKHSDKSFLDLTRIFHNLLLDSVNDDETIRYDDRCFTITNGEYSVRYCFEGYGKHCDRKGFIQNGITGSALIRRMGFLEAEKWQHNFSSVWQDDIRARMYLREMIEDYPNPADRYVASVNLAKKLSKKHYDIRFSGAGYYGSEILFFDADRDDETIMKIEEETATYILPIIKEFYPYICDRYYEENYIPYETWKDIIKRMKEIRDMIINDTYNESLFPFYKVFNLFVFTDDRDDITWQMIKGKPADFVYSKRYEIAELYNIFLNWLERQLYSYDVVIKVQGP